MFHDNKTELETIPEEYEGEPSSYPNASFLRNRLGAGEFSAERRASCQVTSPVFDEDEALSPPPSARRNSLPEVSAEELPAAEEETQPETEKVPQPCDKDVPQSPSGTMATMSGREERLPALKSEDSQAAGREGASNESNQKENTDSEEPWTSEPLPNIVSDMPRRSSSGSAIGAAAGEATAFAGIRPICRQVRGGGLLARFPSLPPKLMPGA
jgi:hypothetical protein